MTQAILAQSAALTALVAQLSAGQDPMHELAGPSGGTRGAQGSIVARFSSRWSTAWQDVCPQPRIQRSLMVNSLPMEFQERGTSKDSEGMESKESWA